MENFPRKFLCATNPVPRSNCASASAGSYRPVTAAEGTPRSASGETNSIFPWSERICNAWSAVDAGMSNSTGLALAANGIQTFCRQRETVWIVAIRTRDAHVIHLALHERTVLVVLFLNLSIREVNAFVQ